MKVARRVFSVVTILLATTWASSAQDYQCQLHDGCSASINNDGERRQVKFRNGDIINTDSGWVLSPDDGWVKVMG